MAQGVSPKVKASAYTTLALSLAGVLLAAVTQWVTGLGADDVPFLGVWAVPVITALTGALNTLAGYLKRDPVLDIGQEAVAEAIAAPVTTVDVSEMFASGTLTKLPETETTVEVSATEKRPE